MLLSDERDPERAVAIHGRPRPLTFVDLFAGAGGLSLGLMMAGLAGLFAVEKEPNAFATLKANLIAGSRFRYHWPGWLPTEPLGIEALLAGYEDELAKLAGSVDVLAGGPPCQGFSSAGLRRQADPRNQLFELYARVAEVLRPTFLVFENVPWITMVFDKGSRERRNPRRLGRPPMPFSERVAQRLDRAGYSVVGLTERAAEFGVPQSRTRYLMVGVRKGTGLELNNRDVRCLLATQRDALLEQLAIDWPVTLEEAISDLVTDGVERIACPDSPGFTQALYRGPRTHYQRVMRDGMAECDGPNSMRLANHRRETIARFKQILAMCRKGVRIAADERALLGIGKESITPLAGDQPAKTLTSLPDDFVHYSEPRILTVRECARIQSFPDWFSFHGKYTTGGQQRTLEVPRYTQVANAVPPILARVIGLVLQDLHRILPGEPSGQGLALATGDKDS